MRIFTRLHWLPVANRVDYKVALITFKYLTAHQPAYFDNLLVTHAPSRSLRSSSQHLLTVPFCRTSLQSRAFSIYAPRLWNSLPQSLRKLAFTSECSDLANAHPTLQTFKSNLKTFLFDSPPKSLVQ